MVGSEGVVSVRGKGVVGVLVGSGGYGVLG